MVDARVRKAQQGYEKKDLDLTKQAHTKHALAEGMHRVEKGRYLGDMVFGAIDGIVTTFAVVAGVAGASLSFSVVLILGFANLFADGFSMAMGNFLSIKSDQDYFKREHDRESWEIDNVPMGEKEEIRQIYRAKGFKGKDLERAVEIITSEKKVWVDEMMKHELNLPGFEEKSAVKGALATFLAFGVAGFIPLVSYLLVFVIPGIDDLAFEIAIILTAIVLFVVGSLRSFLIAKKWYIAGFEMLLVGMLAASVAYLVGFGLNQLL
ncbi:TPA: hypothetical protein HA369_08510 [Candidatus Woesearchaeota archaeon]|nr:hypothetical protein [Candidatus Woesearchaeota archaeon]HII88765.1 hypothetical protein [Candidatus Woesearchaeota archaeon]HIJ04324.1 hypothetical protein [Candidatus Woesearchaeota archaeon]